MGAHIENLRKRLFNVLFGLRQAVIPLINAANNLASPVIDVFTALGGEKGWPDWPQRLTTRGCTMTPTTFAECPPLFCDAQSCDPIHPNNNGYTLIAAAIKKGIGL